MKKSQPTPASDRDRSEFHRGPLFPTSQTEPTEPTGPAKTAAFRKNFDNGCRLVQFHYDELADCCTLTYTTPDGQMRHSSENVDFFATTIIGIPGPIALLKEYIRLMPPIIMAR